MVVIVRKTVTVDGSGVELKTYEPPRALSKEDRTRADRLDHVLEEKMPLLGKEICRQLANNNGPLRRWYLLGKRLRAIVDDRSLVRTDDISTGIIWEAVWYHLPQNLKPKKSAKTERPYHERRHKRKDHLSLCYEVSKFDWDEISWVRGWDNWQQLVFRPGLLRDRRVLRALREEVLKLPGFPPQKEFREIVKAVGKVFPTVKLRDSSLLPDAAIKESVKNSVAMAIRDGKIRH